MNANHDLWWLWILRSISTAMFAMIAVAFPPLTSSLAVYLYGAYVKLDGFVLIGLNTNGSVRHPWLLAAGIIAIGSGVAILMWPASASVALIYVLAILAMVRGVLEVVPPMLNHRAARQRGLRVAAATLIITFGVVLGAHEPLDLRILVGAFALYASLTAVCQLAIGLDQWSHRAEEPTPRKPGSVHRRAPLSGLPI
jgi:uncharacterized membrane protein HdeD (DUF308 family)